MKAECPERRWIVYLDNLFESHAFALLLRSLYLGTISTVRSDSGVFKEFVDMKKADAKKDEIPWGDLYVKVYKDNKVCCFAWKDNALALFMSNCDDGRDVCETWRKRPSETSTAAKSARAFFGNEAVKWVEVLSLIVCITYI